MLLRMLGTLTKEFSMQSKGFFDYPCSRDYNCFLKCLPTKVAQSSLFAFRKKAVRAATLKKWPGNEIPTFRKNKDSMKQLDELVKELLEECAFPQVGFDAQSIHQHVLDILNEKRRSVRKGHDYTKV